MSDRLRGKVALVTGGTAGIGRATAVAFAAEGAQVVVAGRRAAEGAETVRLIERAGGQARFLAADVAQAAEVEALVEQTLAAYGRLDCAFNCAGVAASDSLVEYAEADWERATAVNLKGTWLCMKYEWPRSPRPIR